jgi:hypothetical protein
MAVRDVEVGVDASLPRAERLMSFRESLPPAKRDLAWLPLAHVTLTLPDDQGRYTAFTIKFCPTTGEVAYNIALYGARIDVLP